MSTDAELISWLRRTPLYDSTGEQYESRPDEAADRMEALIAERDKLTVGRVATIHSITLEAPSHVGCGCALCRIRRVCEGVVIDPDPAKLLPDRLCDWRKHSDQVAALIAERDRLKEALEPFESFAANVDENGWTSGIHRESISVWFGPSDFRRARAALSPTQEKPDGH